MSEETLEQKVDKLLGILDKGTEKTEDLMNRGADAYSKASKFKGFFTSWKGIATLSAILGVTVWITGPYWLPSLAPYMYSQPATEAQGFFGQVSIGFQNAFAGFMQNLSVNPWEAAKTLYGVVWPVIVTLIGYLIAMNRIARGAVAVGSKVKNTVASATTSKAEKQLQATVDSLTEEKLSIDRQKQVLEGQVKEAKATITVLEQQLDQTTKVKDDAMKHIDELYSHAGLSRQIEDLGLKRYTEK